MCITFIIIIIDKFITKSFESGRSANRHEQPGHNSYYNHQLLHNSIYPMAHTHAI